MLPNLSSLIVVGGMSFDSKERGLTRSCVTSASIDCLNITGMSGISSAMRFANSTSFGAAKVYNQASWFLLLFLRNTLPKIELCFDSAQVTTYL